MSVLPLPGLRWVQLDGELDVSAEGLALGEPDGPAVRGRLLVVDARGLTFCDVRGIGILEDLVSSRIAGGERVRCILPAHVLRLARLLDARVLLARVAEVAGLVRLAGVAARTLEPPLGEWAAASPALRGDVGSALLADADAACATAAVLVARSAELGARQRAVVAAAGRTVARARLAQGRRRG
jgi:hypothetical protein